MHPSPSTLSRRTRAPSSSSNTPASSRRSVLSLQDSFNDILSPDDSFGSSVRGGGGHGKGQSLAHELVSALDENGGGAGGREGGGAGGMSLAEEFGIFEDVEGLDDPSSSQASTSSLHFQQDDDDDNLLFARPSSSSQHHLAELDEDPHFASHNPHFDFDPHALGIDDRGHFEEDLDGMEHEEDEGDGGQDHTPTRERQRSHRGGASSAARSRASSGFLRSESHQSRSAQSSPSTSPLRSSFRRLSNQPGFPPSDDDGVLPRQPSRSHSRQQSANNVSSRQRLFSSSTSPCRLTPPPSLQYLEPEQQPDLRPSTLIPLLSLSDDRSFEVEHRVTTLLTQIDDQSRKREAMGRELGMLEMEVKRFVGDGGGFESEDEEDLNGAEDASETEEEKEQDGMGGERSFDRSYTSSSGLPVTPTSNNYRPSLPGSPYLSSPYASNHSPSPSKHLNRSFDPDSSLSLQQRHRSSSSKHRSPSALLSPSLTSLTSLTTSLLASLSSLKDTSQIELAGSADLGRRLRALRPTFGGLKAEEEGLDRARREIGRFEDGWALADEAANGDANSVGEEGKLGAEEEGQAEALGGGEVRPLKKDLKGLVEMEMEGFRLALGEFEEKTRAIRDEHQAWLANSASTATAAG